MKRILFTALTLVCVMAASAQSGTNSPYSQYGVGVLSDNGTGFNRAMGGVGQGFHEGNQVNYLNPASYAAVDSLTFVFDVGATLQLTNFSENGRRLNARNADIEYAVATFRVMKGLGASFGIVPFSNIGYNYGYNEFAGSDNSLTRTTNYTGEGGIRNMYFGAAWSPIKGLRIGANIGYLWGDYTKAVNTTFSDSYINTLSRTYAAECSSWKLDLGLQYTQKITSSDNVTIGLTYTPGHALSGDVTMNSVSTNSQTSVTETTDYNLPDALFLPTQMGGGLAWYHGRKWRVGADYSLQKWTEKPFPTYDGNNYKLADNVLMDRQRVALGGEFVPDALSRKYLNRVHIRGGVSYSTPYVKVNGQDGPKSMSASLGFGLPITNAYNNRSLLNVSAEWCRNAAKGMITENVFRINIGLTFNERWFQKWKVE